MKIFVGTISPEGYNILNTYLNAFMPDAEIEPLKPSGIKGKMKNHAVRSDVALVIIDEGLYNECVGVCDDVLSLQKVHKYSDDDGLNQFLISKFGKLEGVSGETGTIPPDVLLQQQEAINQAVVDDEDNLAISEEDTVQSERDSALIEELQKKIAEDDLLIRNLTKQLEDGSAGKDDDISELVGRIRELEGQLSEKEAEIASISDSNDEQAKRIEKSDQILSDFDALKEQLKKANEDKSALEYDKNNLTGQVELLTAQIEEMKNQSAEVEFLKSDRDSIASSKDDEIARLTLELQEKSEQLTAKDDELSSAKEELQVLKASAEESNISANEEMAKLEEQVAGVADLESQINSLTEQVSSLESAVSEKDSEIASKSEEIAKLREASDTASNNSEFVSQALDKTIAEKSELEDKLVSSEQDKLELENKVRELDNSLDEMQDRVNNLELDKSGLQDEIEQLKADLQVSEETAKKSEEDLQEERRKSARLTSELEVSKKIDDSSKTSELRIEIARLKNELEQARNDSSSAEDLEVAQRELQESRDRCASLELDLVDRDEIVKELTDGVFGQMADSAIINYQYSVKLQDLVNIPQSYYCIAGGSYESSMSVYSSIRKACTENAMKRILVVDLTTDSCIDRELSIKNVPKPHDWLFSSASFKDVLAETRLKNVKVISTALAYSNDLSFLKIDWQKKMQDLSGFADITIFVVGCLNNTVSKILFSTFSQAMTSYVIVKATPVNLRSAILNMNGIKDVSPNVTVECVNFDDKASKQMYQRLTTKYKAQILQDSEVLKLA